MSKATSTTKHLPLRVKFGRCSSSNDKTSPTALTSEAATVNSCCHYSTQIGELDVSASRAARQSQKRGLLGLARSALGAAAPIPSKRGAWAVDSERNGLHLDGAGRHLSPSGLGAIAEAQQHLNGHRRDKKHRRSRSCAIDPRKSRAITRWDLLTTACLIFTAIFTPYEVGFVSAPGSYDDAIADGWFWSNRIVDIVFFADLVLQFFLMFPEGHTHGVEGMHWVDDPRMIARKYLKTWFVPDLVGTVCASVFDIAAIGSSAEGDLSRLYAVRMVRALRLIKLIRLVRASRMIKRWESRVSINYALISLGKSALFVVVLAHWFACAWGLQTNFRPLDLTWKAKHHFCVRNDSSLEDHSHPERFVKAEGIHGEWVCVGETSLYIAALYWSIMTITSIGYGDLTANHNSPDEQAISVALMLLGSMAWGNVIATFCGVIAALNPAEVQYKQTMDDLNHFMHIHGMPKGMRWRLREYFHQTKHLQQSASHRSLLATMSPTLQGEVALYINQRWLKRVWFLDRVEDGFLVQVAMNLHAMVFAPGEFAAAGYMYIVHRGAALYFGRMINAGKVWGEDMILNSPRLRYNISAQAMNYLEAFLLGRTELFQVASYFPSSLKHIRMCAAKLALRREVVFRAREMVSAERSSKLSRSSIVDRLNFQASLEDNTLRASSDLQQRAVRSQNEVWEGKGRSSSGLFVGRRKSESVLVGGKAEARSAASEAVAPSEHARGRTDEALDEINSQLRALTRTLQALLPAADVERITTGGHGARERAQERAQADTQAAASGELVGEHPPQAAGAERRMSHQGSRAQGVAAYFPAPPWASLNA
jgi:hypothetical protein